MEYKTVLELKTLATERGLCGYSRLTTCELVQLLQREDHEPMDIHLPSDWLKYDQYADSEFPVHFSDVSDNEYWKHRLQLKFGREQLNSKYIFITSSALDIIQSSYYIHGPLSDENIFAVLYVSLCYGPYNSLFYIYICSFSTTLWFKKNAPTSADYNYDPVQSILIIFTKLFVNDHKSCLVVKFFTSPHICCHYTL